MDTSIFFSTRARAGCRGALGLLAWCSSAGAAPAQSAVPPEAKADSPVAASPWRASGAALVGRGLRFNNPWRLATPLGETAESVSLSATYLELGAALLFDFDAGWRHGPLLGSSIALQGIHQFGLNTAYVLELDLTRASAVRARAGVPIVITPDTTLGLEAAAGYSLDLAWGLGLLGELVGSVYFGAATEERSITTIPMLSLQLGLCFDYPLSW